MELVTEIARSSGRNVTHSEVFLFAGVWVILEWFWNIGGGCGDLVFMFTFDTPYEMLSRPIRTSSFDIRYVTLQDQRYRLKVDDTLCYT